MVQLHFGGLSRAYAVTVGPAPWFRLARNRLEVGPTGKIAGALRSHQWEVQGRYFTGFDCRDEALVNFERPDGSQTPQTGPFPELRVADGTLYADGKIIARFLDEAQLWHCHTTGTSWPVLIIRST